MVKLHDRDNSGCIGLGEFRSLHMQLTEIRVAFAAAAQGGDAISQQQVEQLVQQQGGRQAGLGWRTLLHVAQCVHSLCGWLVQGERGPGQANGLE